MSGERRKRTTMKERVQETFGPGGEGLQEPPDRRGKVIEALVAFVLGTGFWRLVVSDNWVTSVVFGVLLAALLFSYGLFRSRMVEKAAGRAGGDPPRKRRPRD